MIFSQADDCVYNMHMLLMASFQIFKCECKMLNSIRPSLEPSILDNLAFLHDNLDYVIELLNT
jgi:hypothetical protein